MLCDTVVWYCCTVQYLTSYTATMRLVQHLLLLLLLSPLQMPCRTAYPHQIPRRLNTLHPPGWSILYCTVLDCTIPAPRITDTSVSQGWGWGNVGLMMEKGGKVCCVPLGPEWIILCSTTIRTVCGVEWIILYCIVRLGDADGWRR